MKIVILNRKKKKLNISLVDPSLTSVLKCTYAVMVKYKH